ncbi:MAG: sigma-70 family RNA polymerase sigma factor [Verrucomicrobia bacterium]|jgi:RNA polymerase sigma-70 factor (ECF subfamily)|nr:sigma-70 family RNA polymerase sigma factor [Verrucomicrobiota bacterium]
MTEAPASTFESLVTDYYAPLYRFAYSLSKNAEDAGDLTQQTFLIYARKGDSVRDEGKIKSWLFTTLYREFLRKARRDKTTAPVDQEILEENEDPLPVDSLRQLEAKEAVEFLHTLEPQYREPLILFYMEDLAYKEIAELLEIPIGTVMSRLSRGKEQLKSRLSANLRK